MTSPYLLLKTTSMAVLAGLMATSALADPRDSRLSGTYSGPRGDQHRDATPDTPAPQAAAPTPAPAAPQQARNDRHDDDRHDNRNDSRDNHDWDNRHDDRDRGRDHGRYNPPKHSNNNVVVNFNSGPYYRSPRYMPVPVIYRHDPVRYYPRYYSSAYYSQRYIPIEPANQYVEVRCTNSQSIMGTVVGGSAGALLGNQLGRGHRDRFAATIGGALLGAVIGHQIDRVDESCAYQALEYAEPNTQVTWVNPEDDHSYVITPGPVDVENGRYCREYQAKVLVGNQLQDGYGRACRQPDGSWQIID